MFSISSAYSVELLPMFDEDTYSVGDWSVITVEDHSKNTIDDKTQNIIITVHSDSEPDAKQLVLIETGLNTGIFTGTIQLTSTPSQDTLFVNNGDSIHAMYHSFIKTSEIKKSDSNISPILVATDKIDYKVGEIIVISGTV